VSSSRSQHMDQVKSVTTLRSGKVIEKPILEPCEKNNELISEGKEMVEPEHCKEKANSPPVLPFSHDMTKQRKGSIYLCWMLLNMYLLMLNF